MPKRGDTLPVILSPEEVVRFLDGVARPKHRMILTTCYGTPSLLWQRKHDCVCKRLYPKSLSYFREVVSHNATHNARNALGTVARGIDPTDSNAASRRRIAHQGR